MLFLKSNLSLIKQISKKIISIFVIFSFFLTECVRASERNEQLNSSHISSSIRDYKPLQKEEMDIVLFEGEKSFPHINLELEEHKIIENGAGVLDSCTNEIDDGNIDEYINELCTNYLVDECKTHISYINGEQITKKYNKRQAALLIMLSAGVAASFIGSLTFLVGKKFPREFADFAHLPISDEVADGIGNTLGWCNVILESLFYTWTVSGLLPPWQPEEITKSHEDNMIPISYPSNSHKYWNNFISLLPSASKWGLAMASSVPLTFLSLIDQEAGNTSVSFDYTVVGSIALVTFISNKYFLDLTHKQIENIYYWLNSAAETDTYFIDDSFSLLEETKKTFLNATLHANEKLRYLSKPEVKERIQKLKSIAAVSPTLEEAHSDKRWINLLNYMFEDLTFSPEKVNNYAMFLVPSLAVFAACSWLGLIATVPHGVEKKLSHSTAVQYTLMIIAGIPLLAIGLSMGGSFGYKLSQLGSRTHSVSENIAHPVARFLGYIPITLVGLGSFATTATLSIQQFKSIPAIAWMLLPSSILGMDLINISSGLELWDDVLIGMSKQFNPDSALFVDNVNFANDLYKKIECTSPQEIAGTLLSLEPSIQMKIHQLSPLMKNIDFNEWVNSLKKDLKKERLRTSSISADLVTNR